MNSRYKLGSIISTDRTGETYQATDTQLDRQVAVRRLFADADPEAVESAKPVFSHFMGKLSMLRSQALIQVVDGGYDDEGFYQVVELLDGKLLSERLRKGPLELEEFEQFSKDLMTAISELHAHYLFHTALGAQSIRLTKHTLGGQRYKLIDLGLCSLARSIRKERGARHYGLIEEALMPPEYFEGKTPSHAMDQYNCGQLFYASLVGGHPLAGLDREEIHRRIVNQDYPSVHEYRKELPEELGEWIARMTAPDPMDRYPSIQRALEDRPNIPELAIRLMSTRRHEFFHTQHSKTSLQPRPRIQDMIEADPKNRGLRIFATIVTLLILLGCFAALMLGYSF